MNSPLDYNNELQHTIEVDSSKADIIKRMFELYATRQYSLAEVREVIHRETGRAFQKGYIHNAAPLVRLILENG